MNKPLKQIPTFANETEERAFWETNDSADYVDWTKAKRVVLPNYQPVRLLDSKLSKPVLFDSNFVTSD